MSRSMSQTITCRWWMHNRFSSMLADGRWFQTKNMNVPEMFLSFQVLLISWCLFRCCCLSSLCFISYWWDQGGGALWMTSEPCLSPPYTLWLQMTSLTLELFWRCCGTAGGSGAAPADWWLPVIHWVESGAWAGCRTWSQVQSGILTAWWCFSSTLFRPGWLKTCEYLAPLRLSTRTC